MNARPNNKRSPGLRTTLAYFAAFTALGLTTATLGPTLEALAEQTTAQISQISYGFALRSLGYLAGSLLAGRLYDRLRGHPLMGLALVVMAAGMAFVPHIPVLLVLLAVLLIVGLGEGMLDVGGNTLIVWLHGRKVGPYMNGLHFFFGLGSLLAPIIVAQVVDRTGNIVWVYGLIALATLPAMLGLFSLPSPPIQNQESDEDSGPRTGRAGMGLIVLLVIFFVLYVGAEVSYGGWIYLYAVKAAQVPEKTAAYITSVFWGAFTIGRLLSIPVSARLKPQTILGLDFAGALLAVSLFFLWPGQTWAIWAASALFGVSIASIFPTMLTYTGEHIPITARVTAYFFVGATLGSMLLPWLVGQFFERVGPQVLTGSLLIDVLAGIITLVALTAAFTRRAAQFAVEG